MLKLTVFLASHLKNITSGLWLYPGLESVQTLWDVVLGLQPHHSENKAKEDSCHPPWDRYFSLQSSGVSQLRFPLVSAPFSLFKATSGRWPRIQQGYVLSIPLGSCVLKSMSIATHITHLPPQPEPSSVVEFMSKSSRKQLVSNAKGHSLGID